jgi:hypothetical protein
MHFNFSLKVTINFYISETDTNFIDTSFDFVLVIVLLAGHSGRAVWDVGLGRLVAEIRGSNPAQGMDVCPRLSVLCCPV